VTATLATPDTTTTTAAPTEVVKPEVGELYRHAETGNLLFIIGKRTTTFDVFDLDINQHLVLDAASFVADETDALTEEQLAAFANWFSADRRNTRKIAVREYKADRWCMEGLNEALRELGMEHYEPTLGGKLTIQVPFEVDDTSTPRSEIERAVNAALAAAGFAQAVESLPIKGVALEPDAVSVRASDFTRR
jgi:hypothetical protein